MFPDLGTKYIHIKEIGNGGTGVVNLAVGHPYRISGCCKIFV